MEKDRKRALRRYHNDRMQTRAIRMLEDWHWFWNEEDPNEKHETARRWRDNMCRLVVRVVVIRAMQIGLHAETA